MKYIKISAILLLLNYTSCKEEYFPPNGSLEKQLLVVEANLDPSGTTSVFLTRTTEIQDPVAIINVNNAVVAVEGRDNTVRPLVFSGNGIYKGTLNLTLDHEYRLRIKTGGKEYLSDYVRTIYNPPLDTITWEENDKGVKIYVNTIDPTNTAKYFRWDYFETWEIRSAYFASLIYVNGIIRDRVFPTENVFYCWKNSNSTQIFLANSTQLQSSILSRVPILQILSGDEKLYFRYSIIAKQYALEKDAYNFFEILKKNTEGIGSFFGPLPSELRGNIHCLNDKDEPVIGYVTSSAVTEKRIFINASELSYWPRYYECTSFDIPNNRDSILDAIGSGLLPYDYVSNPPPPARIYFSQRQCVDCTTRGAVNVKPLFW